MCYTSHTHAQGRWRPHCACTSNAHAHSQVHHEVAALISHRNRLAAHMAPPVGGQRGGRRPHAPPMLQDSFACERCPAAETCAVHHKVWTLCGCTAHHMCGFSLE